jgi:hypothetical protein
VGFLRKDWLFKILGKEASIKHKQNRNRCGWTKCRRIIELVCQGRRNETKQSRARI